MKTDEHCHTCGQSGEWHQINQPRHPFNDGNLATAETFGQRVPGGTQRPPAASEPVTESPWPFDPVLRQALIDKGVLTPDDLVRAERTIRAVTAQFTSEAQK